VVEIQFGLFPACDAAGPGIVDDADSGVAAIALAGIEAELVDLARSLHAGRGAWAARVDRQASYGARPVSWATQNQPRSSDQAFAMRMPLASASSWMDRSENL